MGRIQTNFRMVVIFGQAVRGMGLGKSTNRNLAVLVDLMQTWQNFFNMLMFVKFGS